MVINRGEGVAESSVVGIPDKKWGEAVLALVVAKKGASLTEEYIINYCGEYLASYKKPKKVIFRDTLPVSAQGKILKRELKKEFWKEEDRLIH